MKKFLLFFVLFNYNVIAQDTGGASMGTNPESTGAGDTNILEGTQDRLPTRRPNLPKTRQEERPREAGPRGQAAQEEAQSDKPFAIEKKEIKKRQQGY
jgi:phage tail tape-measure protein